MSEEASRDRVMVDAWDSPTRILHWVNAILIVLLVLEMYGKDFMGALGVDREPRRAMNTIHAYTGFVLIVFFCLRIVWAFVGNQYAKWGDMWPFSGERRRQVAADVMWHLKGFRGRPAVAVGHGALASVMYLLLYVVLAIMVVTGFLLSGLETDLAPATFFVGGMSEESAEGLQRVVAELHELGSWYLVFFFFIHVASLMIHEVKEKSGLFSSMVSGKKFMEKDWR